MWAIRAVFYSFFFGKIGFPSYIGRPIFLKGIDKVFIGKRVRIFPNLRLEVHGADARISIGNNVAIGQNVHITSAENLIIGDSSTILANVFITNIDHDYKEIGRHILDQRMIISKTEIGENCFIGIGACIQAGTILGKQCVVGAGSIVKGTFPDYSVIVGVPGKIVKRFNIGSKKWEKTNPEGIFIK
jgi:acetyltransferase-like isoleucine patch superfamily enzyme